MTVDVNEIISEAEQEREEWRDYLRPAAEWFHDHEGEMFEREEAENRISEEHDVSPATANKIISGLVGDKVDPVVQVISHGTKHVGVAEFHEFDGAYGYLDYHDRFGKRNRVVCAQCVHDSEYDENVVHATGGEGSFGPDADYAELLDAVHDHYDDAHDGVPENVETGASLVSGTTIGGNTAWHAGNDGNGSGLYADEAASIAGRTFNESEFTSPGTYNVSVPSEADWVKVYLVGGGGGGSSGGSHTDVDQWGGGGGGALTVAHIPTRVVGSTLTVEVGSGGSGHDGGYTSSPDGDGGGPTRVMNGTGHVVTAEGGGGGNGNSYSDSTGGSGGSYTASWVGYGVSGLSGTANSSNASGGDAADGLEGNGATSEGANGSYPGGGGAGGESGGGNGANGYAKVVFF